MRAADLPAVTAIAAVVHPGYPEDDAVLAERLALYPQGCFVLAHEGGGAIGYLLSHPWRADDPPPLNTFLRALPDVAETYYLHDLALLPQAQGSGAAAMIVRERIAFAAQAGFATVALVAVNNSGGFWRRLGFAAREVAGLTEKLASYGGGVFLRRDLPA
ncbi:MAG: GNAT family N-acetyltransferase [Rhodospirillales bacterium]|nr:GNAT family N-acetyltransferase [Rhodospirillales bacterium]MDE2574345.1 GNAT family N-acetyltransferase [Rhodospirillales bacterium]